MEAVDTALADPRVRALVEPLRLGHDSVEHLEFDSERDVWVVGACGWFDGERVAFKVGVLEPRTGAVLEIIDGPAGATCEEGPWATIWGPLAVADDPALGGLDVGFGPGRLASASGA